MGRGAWLGLVWGGGDCEGRVKWLQPGKLNLVRTASQLFEDYYAV